MACDMASSSDSDSEDGVLSSLVYSKTVKPFLYEPVINKDVTEQAEGSSNTDYYATETHDEAASSQQILTDWCKCNHCELMPSEAENVCCSRYKAVTSKKENFVCITNHPGFVSNCLNPYVLECSFYEYLHNEGPIGDDEDLNELYRYIAYRRFVFWVWKRLGKQNRKILPACVVNSIRQAFPSANYKGFIPA